MSTVLTFWVDGRPVAKERAGRVKTKSGKLRGYNPKRTTQWENLIRLIAQSACAAQRWQPEKARYTVHVDVYRARKAGDGDNYLKAAKDALNGIVWPDDRMVFGGSYLLHDGEGVGMNVRVTREAA
jgi:Holliday junction resolvase RusA-like endonuclease